MDMLRELYQIDSATSPPGEITDLRRRPRSLTIIEGRAMAGDLLCRALRQALPDVEVGLVGGLNEVGRSSSGVVLYSFADRGCDGATLAQAVARIKAALPGCGLVAIADDDGDRAPFPEDRAVDAWISAASGFDALVATLRAVIDRTTIDGAEPVAPVVAPGADRPGSPVGLTAKERRILRLIHEGKPNKTIAFELTCSESTVKVHVANMMRKLRLHNRTQLALLYRSGSPEGEAAQAPVLPSSRLVIAPDELFTAMRRTGTAAPGSAPAPKPVQRVTAEASDAAV